jgi:hypothetical protein
VVGDAARPGIDFGPVAEVTLWKHCAGGWHLPHQAFGKPESAGVQRSEEDAMVLGPDGPPELGDLLGLGSDGQISPHGVGGLGA